MRIRVEANIETRENDPAEVRKIARAYGFRISSLQPAVRKDWGYLAFMEYEDLTASHFQAIKDLAAWMFQLKDGPVKLRWFKVEYID